jgi:hypothetical protein
VSAPSAGATRVIIETERLRMRAHRDDEPADLLALAGNWEIAPGTGRYRTCIDARLLAAAATIRDLLAP